MGVMEIHESLGFKNHGTSNYQSRAVFYYEPLLRLYKLEIPSLFGRLMKDEGMFLDRSDPGLFNEELDELLVKFGPLIWPIPGQGPRDHLLKPADGTRYTSLLVYPRDKDRLRSLLRNLILSKHARPGTDFDALIEKRHKDANLKVSKKSELGDPQARKNTLNSRRKKARSAGRDRTRRQTSLTQESSDLPETASDSAADFDDSFVLPTARRRVRTKSTDATHKVALRLFCMASSKQSSPIGPCQSYGTIFIDNNIDSASRCFTRIDLHTHKRSTYIEFHPPEDMSLQSRFRIERESEEADETFEQVLAILREARKFPGEPSYRTVEVEIGSDTMLEG